MLQPPDWPQVWPLAGQETNFCAEKKGFVECIYNPVEKLC